MKWKEMEMKWAELQYEGWTKDYPDTVYKIVKYEAADEYSKKKYHSLAPCLKARNGNSPESKSAELEYKLNEKTSCLPESAGIFVFPHLSHAYDYATHFDKSAILKCIFSGELIKQDTVFTRMATFLTGHYLEPIPKSWKFTRRSPKGTYSCESVTPIKELYTFRNYDGLSVEELHILRKTYSLLDII